MLDHKDELDPVIGNASSSRSREGKNTATFDPSIAGSFSVEMEPQVIQGGHYDERLVVVEEETSPIPSQGVRSRENFTSTFHNANDVLSSSNGALPSTYAFPFVEEQSFGIHSFRTNDYIAASSTRESSRSDVEERNIRPDWAVLDSSPSDINRSRSEELVNHDMMNIPAASSSNSMPLNKNYDDFIDKEGLKVVDEAIETASASSWTFADGKWKKESSSLEREERSVIEKEGGDLQMDSDRTTLGFSTILCGNMNTTTESETCCHT
jgi:hypothetical protein